MSGIAVKNYGKNPQGVLKEGQKNLYKITWK